MIHSASPQSRPVVILAWIWSFGTDGQTVNLRQYSDWPREWGRPRGSIWDELVWYHFNKNPFAFYLGCSLSTAEVQSLNSSRKPTQT